MIKRNLWGSAIPLALAGIFSLQGCSSTIRGTVIESQYRQESPLQIKVECNPLLEASMPATYTLTIKTKEGKTAEVIYKNEFGYNKNNPYNLNRAIKSGDRVELKVKDRKEDGGNGLIFSGVEAKVLRKD